MRKKSGFLVFAVSAMLWLPVLAWAQIGEVRVGVDGMTCVT